MALNHLLWVQAQYPLKSVRKSRVGEDQADLVEANEAFAAQAISVNKELGFTPDKINVNGGAIALGHPIGVLGQEF